MNAVFDLYDDGFCGLCGNEPSGLASSWDPEFGHVHLCHGDFDPEPTCYMRWQMGERPPNPAKVNEEVN